jgi:CBS domain-containing protein
MRDDATVAATRSFRVPAIRPTRKEANLSMQAKDIMTVNVISVAEDTPVHEIVRLLLRHRISAVPVVDGARNVVGIVSEGDLLRPEGTGTRRPRWLEAVSAGRPVAYEQGRDSTAATVMTRNVIAVEEDARLNDIAELLERQHIKRVPVLRDGKLAGIVSRANLLHGLADAIVDRHEPGAAKDRQIRHELMRILLEEHKLDTVCINVTVNDGNVRLWGVVDNADEAATAEGAAKALPGVRSVQNNLGPGPMSGVPV